MPCLERFGNITLTDDFVASCIKQADGRYQSSSVTLIGRATNHEEMTQQLSPSSLEISDMFAHGLCSIGLYRSEPVPMHPDVDIEFKYGMLLMVDVPQGAFLKQLSGPDIPIRRGDLIRIRYWQNHELVMANGSHLFFIALDFAQAKKALDGMWKEKISSLAT